MSGEAPIPDPAQVLRISFAAEPELIWVVLHGALDLGSLPAAEREVETAERKIVGDAPAEGRRATLGLDLSRLDYIDSSGVRLVLMVDQRAGAAGNRVAVRLGDGAARRVFDMLEITPHLLLADPVADTDPARRGTSR